MKATFSVRVGVSIHGFGFGIWRSVMSSDQVIWSVCIGPFTWYIAQALRGEVAE